MTVGVYVHWPYCRTICNYCDFNKVLYTGSHSSSVQRLVRAVPVALGRMLYDESDGAKRPTSKRVHSVYFGGGTPSLSPPEFVAKLLSHVRDRMQPGCEVTLEVNPSSHLQQADLEAFRSAGINRVSVGVQTFNDRHLRALARDHDAATAHHTLDMVHQVFGPERTSFDLMFGLPRQTIEEWQSDLEQTKLVGSHHISLYELTLKPNTGLHNMFRRKGLVHAPSEEFYFTAVDTLESLGRRHYEVSNFAVPGHESQHNLGYWRGMDYIGVGPGAVGHVYQNNQHVEITSIANQDAWSANVLDQGGQGVAQVSVRDAEAQLHELVLCGLRTIEGVCVKHVAETVFNAACGATATATPQILHACIERVVHECIVNDLANDLITFTPPQEPQLVGACPHCKSLHNHVIPTERGMAVHNALAFEISDRLWERLSTIFFFQTCSRKKNDETT
eukprot:m.102644 g.102644  ORF g.102644 m.102644 type:complete len:447 (-) comp13226_c0_seq12:177-1517(-)